jgi:translation elongation factor EF-1beta
MQYKKVNKDLMAKVNQYEVQLAKGMYLNGSQLTSLDKDAADFLKPFAAELSPISHPNVFGWFSFVSKLSPKMMANLPVVAAAPAKKDAKKDDVDMDDLFGDDDEDDGAAAKAAAAKAKEASKPKKEKKKVIAMSIVFLEVKPLDDTIDLDALAPKIYKGIVKDGLFWKTEYKKVPVAFGIFKLIVAFSCEDEKISVDDITEEIENMTDFV